MAGRFVSQKDINLFNTINKELVGDLKNGKDGIINQTVVLYKLSVEDTQVNMYGESSNGKSYLSGVSLACLIEAEDFDFNTDEFGPDLRQDATFSFQRDVLLDLDLVVEVGDVINWNFAHWEIRNVNENQLLGGQFEQNHSVICLAHLTRASHIGVERVRST
mgnify:FL=1|tara:strand:- start:287 stop:772 length:486 start_codon:yes stop_codon:yes gene_type:complete